MPDKIPDARRIAEPPAEALPPAASEPAAVGGASRPFIPGKRGGEVHESIVYVTRAAVYMETVIVRDRPKASCARLMRRIKDSGGPILPSGQGSKIDWQLLAARFIRNIWTAIIRNRGPRYRRGRNGLISVSGLEFLCS